MKTIDISKELERFKLHLESNPQTILSAKFGDGKTYFLNEYMNQHSDDTFFVVLRPVNYIVSPNEDIFEYIKRDILCLLMSSNEYKKINWNQVIKKSANCETILDTIEGVSNDVPYGGIIRTVMSLFKKVNKKYTINHYFNHFKDTKGGLFEFDQFSFAIKHTIEKIQKNRKCVLIIEDLDRLDPGHLFRILNVLSAHIDLDKSANKFGFDNVVAVLDYETTKHIFTHFYGAKANYDGYMSKFMSSHPFEYSITRVAHDELVKYLEKECNIPLLFEFPNNANNVSLPNAISSLSVRDVKHILDNLEEQIIQTEIPLPFRGKIKSVDYITKFLSILVRMGYRIEYEKLLGYFIDDYHWFQMLNNYVLLSQGRYTGMLTINSNRFCYECKYDNDICSIVWSNMLGGRESEFTVKEIADKALRKAISMVKDGKQILVDTIPVGEVYYE